MSKYISNSSMSCTQSSMELMSKILGFDIVELWTEEPQDPHLHCTYVHAEESLLKLYPSIIVGHYPNHKKPHQLSPIVCNLAKASVSHCHWNVLPAGQDGSLHPEFHTPFKTEMAYMLDQETDNTSGLRVFIVAFAIDRIEFGAKKAKFISGLGFSIFVAAFDLDEDEDKEENGAELDTTQAFAPRPLPPASAKSMSPLESGLGLWPTSTSAPDPPTLARSASGSVIVDAALSLSRSSPTPPVGRLLHRALSQAQLKEKEEGQQQQQQQQQHNEEQQAALVASSPPAGTTPAPARQFLPPTWDPIDFYAFPVAEIPVRCPVPDNLLMEHFSELQHIADGSNSNIFLARFGSEKVIIKMMMAQVQHDPLATHEFDVEQGLLSRVSHPNIVKLLGAGRIPRRFIVLEHLAGGSLSTILAANQSAPELAQKLFRRPTFTYASLLSRAADAAEALRYLHECVHPGATIIHRDIKPDNVGFTASGQLKLFDFGLCTCVRQRRSKDEAFEMTGNTGSLRYMAPEVALRQAYSEKIDVYSFGIMVWQMARDRVPFKGMDRGQFMSEVVLGGDRPKWVSSFGHNLHLSQSGIPLPWPYTPPLHSPLLQQA